MNHASIEEIFGTALKFFSKNSLGISRFTASSSYYCGLPGDRGWLMIQRTRQERTTSLSQSKESTLTGGCLGVDFCEYRSSQVFLLAT